MIDVACCKQLLPMPLLLEKLGYADRATKTSKCIFHEEKNPSAGIFQKDGLWYYKCHACGASGDEVDVLAMLRGGDKGKAIREYGELAGVQNGSIPLIEEAAKIFGGKIISSGGGKVVPAPETGSSRSLLDETKRVKASQDHSQVENRGDHQLQVQVLPARLSGDEIEKLAKWRGYSREFVRRLSERKLIGTYKGAIAFPCAGGMHYRNKKDGSWRYAPQGVAKPDLYVIGAVEEGAAIHCFESPWDALSYADASGEDNNIVATRGAQNGKLVSERFKGHAGTLYLWPQNDEPGQKWARDIREALPNEQVKLVQIPKELFRYPANAGDPTKRLAPFTTESIKDLNDWRKAGATDGDLWNAWIDAKEFVTVPSVLAEPKQAEAAMATARENTTGSQAIPEKPDSRGGDNNLPPQAIAMQAYVEASDKAIAAFKQKPDRSLAGTLDQVVAFLHRYMRFEQEWQPDICAIWAAYSWVFRAFSRTPYLYIFSPEPSCGKSQLKNCIYYLSPPEPRRWRIVAPSEAALFRKIHKDSPAVFLDEIDKYFSRTNEDHPITGILNSGYEVGDPVPRCIGRTGELEEFNVFCPKCFTGIGKLPDTVATRSIHIHLTRQSSDDRAEPFEGDFVAGEVADIIKFFTKWEDGAVAKLKQARLTVQIPPEIDDGRKREIIRPILAVADLAGEKWGERARAAAIAAFSQNLEASSDKTKLLSAFRAIFKTKDCDRIATNDLLHALIGMDDGPWATWFERDMAQNRMLGPARKIATMLKDFGIHSHNIRLDDDEQVKGYMAVDFVSVWKRYLPSELKLVNAELGL